MKLKTNIRKALGLLLLLVIFQACQSEYANTVRKERWFGGNHNELLFDLEIGQPMQAFFDRCTELNKQKKITQGSGIFAKTFLLPKNEVDPKIEMQFYGIQNTDKIMTGMRLRFAYTAWSPWNEALQAEALVIPIQDSLMQWFPGNSFFEVPTELENKTAFIKIDGNRRIKMLTLDAQQLSVKIEDISNKYKK